VPHEPIVGINPDPEGTSLIIHNEIAHWHGPIPSCEGTSCTSSWSRSSLDHTVQRDWNVFGVVRPPREKRLPIVLSRDEVRRVLHCFRIDVYRVCLSTVS
jgi:hypothetical protein